MQYGKVRSNDTPREMEANWKFPNNQNEDKMSKKKEITSGYEWK